MDSPTTLENGNAEERVSFSNHSLPPDSHRDPPTLPVKSKLHLRGSGSYPTMVWARTANRNKIAKRTSDSMIITGHHHHVSGTTSCGTGIGTSEASMRSGSTKKRKLLNNKRTVFSKASRRKSLENLGLLVRNRCGTAKLQWPSEKKETDVFDLLPEGCIQVRQLIRLKSRGGGTANSGDQYCTGSGDFFNNGERDRNRCRRRRGDNEKGGQADDPCCENENEENNNKTEGGKGSLTSEARLRFQGRRCETSSSNTRMDWKNKKNISVIVRIRPKQDKEVVEKSIVFRTDSKTIVFDPKEKTKDFYFQGVKQVFRSDFGRKRPNRNVSFQYDKVYGPEATNKEIFEEMLKDLTDHLIEGYNSTVFAYGATGSGKTYTMIGSNSNPGLTVLMVESLYKRIDDLAEDYDCEVVCSYLEVYNETIKDLLRPEKELSIREDGKKGIIISELSFYKPRGPQELLKLLRSGNRARTQHATDLNSESSRSHAVFEVKLCLKRKRNKKCQEKGGSRSSGGGGKYQEQAENIKDDDDQDVDDDDGKGCCRRSGCSGDGGGRDDDDDDEHDGINKVEVIQSKLVMVDLAGSERGTAATSSNHGGGGVFVDGARQREGASINKSLLALASCISALADGKCHVPYRNSKLTRLLKDSLNGLCTTVMIANISPSALTSEDTYNTLKYADRAKSIVGPVVKQKNIFMEDLMVEDCAKTQMLELQLKNVQLQEQLEEEKLKRELVLKELEEVHRKNVEMKSEVGREDRNALLGENSIVKGRGSRGKSIMGGDGSVLRQQSEIGDYGIEEGFEEGCFTGKNTVALTEDQLPSEIQQYSEIVEERARIFSDYVEFASQARLTEWATSCKKLKADMADFLGRLPVEDENYIWFSKLKNEVNNDIGSFRNNSAGALAAASNENDHHHKKYAVKLKNLTEKLELERQKCFENTFLCAEDDHTRGEVQSSDKLVAITVEQFLEFKRLSCEQEGNERVNQFYQQFCQQINNQLLTSGITLMNALRMVKSVYLQLRQVDQSSKLTVTTAAGGNEILTPALLQEYKELLNLVYGPGPPIPPKTQESNGMETEYNNNNNNNGSANNDIIFRPLSSLSPQIPPQLSNLGRKSSPIMDDLANMRKLVERPLLIPLLGTTEQETEIKRTVAGLDLDEDLELRRVDQERGSNSTFSRFVTTAANRKTLSTSHTIYDLPQPPPATRVRGRESSPELQLPSHHRPTCVEEQGEKEEEDDLDETRYNDDDVEDNDHHYHHPFCAIDNDDDSASNGPFQGETSVVATANENSRGKMRTSLHDAITNIIDADVGCNLVNPVKRKNSTSFEIIFDKKEDKRVGGRLRHGKTGKLAKDNVRVSEKSFTPFGPSVMSALSKEKISENHFNDESAVMNEDWTTATSASDTATTTSVSTSAENVMMKGNNKTGSGIDCNEGGGGPGSVQQKKSIGNRRRLTDQALIKDYHQRRHPNQRQQTKAPAASAEEMDPMQEKNGNKNCLQDEQEEIEQGNPSSYIYQLDSPPSPSSIDILGDTGKIDGNKRGFGNVDGDCAERQTSKRKVVQSCTTDKNNKMDMRKESSTAFGGVGANRKVNTTLVNSTYNPNPLRHRGHLKQQEKEEQNGVLPAAIVRAKPDIGSSLRNNNKLKQNHQRQQCSKTSNNKSNGSGRGKSLNPLLSVPAGVGVITSTPPLEFPMSVQGQRKSQNQQRLLQYKVTFPVKKPIALHPSKASIDLTSKSSEKADVHHHQQKLGHSYPSQQKSLKETQHEDVLLMMVGSGEEESEWEARSNCNMINMPHTNQESKQDDSQNSLLSSARSTMSHQKGPYHTNSKTFTISRESLPTANMPVISSFRGNNSQNTNMKLSLDKSMETLYRRQQWDEKGELVANYSSSNEYEDFDCDEDVGVRNYEDNNGNYTSAEDNDNDGATSCYSDA